jgi:hypothetical protein
MRQTRVVEKIETQFHVQYFSKIVPFLDNAEKYGKARQAKDDNTIRCREDATGMPD